jgi:hypothetical protein
LTGQATDLEPVALSFRVRERPGDTLVEFFGEIDENADFGELRRRLQGNLVFHLAEVRRISSCGVREWVNFVRELGQPLPGGDGVVTELVFTHCSPAIVTQLNMIYNFRGNARIRSFYAPYVCEQCGQEEEKLVDVPTHGRQEIPVFACSQCGSTMEFDDLPERYLSFLAES